jgi:hypothetical protein
MGAQHLVVSKRPRATPPALELRDRSQLVACLTEVCESTRRDGGWVFPAHANTGEPFGPVDAFRYVRGQSCAPTTRLYQVNHDLLQCPGDVRLERYLEIISSRSGARMN